MRVNDALSCTILDGCHHCDPCIFYLSVVSFPWGVYDTMACCAGCLGCASSVCFGVFFFNREQLVGIISQQVRVAGS